MVGQGYLCNGPYNLGLNEDTDMDTLSFYNQISDSIKRGIIGYSVKVGRELRHFPVREFYRAVNYAKNMDGILMYEEHSDRKGTDGEVVISVRVLSFKTCRLPMRSFVEIKFRIGDKSHESFRRNLLNMQDYEKYVIYSVCMGLTIG